MASQDSGVDTSNDSNSALDASVINLRQMERSIADYVTFMQPALESTRTLTSLISPASSSCSLHCGPQKRGRVFSRPRGGSRSEAGTSSYSGGLNVPYSSNFPKESKLRLAATISNTELLNRLLETGVNPDAADEHLRSPLHLSASRGMSIEVNGGSVLGRYLRLLLVIAGYSQIVKSLLAHGANPNIQDTLGNTPLHLAVCSASSYNFNLVKLLAFYCLFILLILQCKPEENGKC